MKTKFCCMSLPTIALRQRAVGGAVVNGRCNQRERGFSLIVSMLSLSVLIGMLGLAFDLGHMFIVRSELQAFADASAMASGAQLDGTSAGIIKANNTATAGPIGATVPNGFDFDVNPIANVNATFATSSTGTYDSFSIASSYPTNNYRFIKVTAREPVPVYFITILNLFSSQPGVVQGGTQSGTVSSQFTLTAIASAGQQGHSSITNGGLVPFSPAAHNANDTTNFGFVPGIYYTIKWGNGNSTSCAGDSGFNPGNSASQHDFVDLGQGNSNNLLRNAIKYGGYPNAYSTPSSVTAGDSLYSVPGNRGSSIFGAAAERSLQDPDQTSTTWAQYVAAGTGNGRRVITTPIHDPATNTGHGSNEYSTIVGFGNFLLDVGSTISGNSGSMCATYIGPASMTGGAAPATDGTKVYTIALSR